MNKRISSDFSFKSLCQRVSWGWIWPLIPIIVGLGYIAARLGDPIMYDPEHVFLPAARSLLDHGWNFFLQPQSASLAPLSYLWPALWGVNITAIRIANMGLWVLCVWFMWRATLMLGGIRAAATAMLLMLFPELMRNFPSEMSEPIYFLGIFGWIWALASTIIGPAPSKRATIVGAVMLTFSLLSRPVLQFIAPASLIFFLLTLAYWAFRTAKSPSMDTLLRVRALALMLGLGLVIPSLVVLFNGWQFGFWGIRSGSGLSLYMGMHPLFEGTETSLHWFQFDIVAHIKPSPLTGYLDLDGDRRLEQVAHWQIKGMPLGYALFFFSRKLAWWLLQSPVEITRWGSVIRKLRLFEFLVIGFGAAMGLWAWWQSKKDANKSDNPSHAKSFARWSWGQINNPKRAFLLAVVVIFLLLLAQLLPFNYNSRYSIAILDPWLMLLTSLGFAVMLQPLRLCLRIDRSKALVQLQSSNCISLWKLLLLLAAVLALPFILYRTLLSPGPFIFDEHYTGKMIVRYQTQAPQNITVLGASSDSDGNWIVEPSEQVTLMIPIDPSAISQAKERPLANPLWKLALWAKLPEKGSNSHSCSTALFSWQNPSGQRVGFESKILIQAFTLPIKSDGMDHRLMVPAVAQLYPAERGYLRVDFSCPAQTQIRFNGLQLLESDYLGDALEHLEQK